jgi:predicted ATPase/DNA-binding CsgD family transcriptional regulator
MMPELIVWLSIRPESVRMVSRLLAPERPIPTPLTALVGRVDELSMLHTLLAREEVRLVTLTGPGGVGKTRLAIQVVCDIDDEFPDGIAFIDLAPVRDAELAISTIAQGLGIPDTEQGSLLERIAFGLNARRFLLVLDNLEQVMGAGDVIGRLLSVTSQMTILVTSREVLRLSGEYEFTVAPLSLPAPGATDLDEIAEIESVRLFVQRARSVRIGFELTRANAAGIAELCARLDGLPLAIELAAARLRHLSPQALLARLSGRLTILTGGARDLPARLQTMRAAISWSYDLLSHPDQALFRRLSVFFGGFTIEAAERIGGGGFSGGSDASPVLDGIGSLVDKSLVTVVNGEDGESRYQMLETIREFGQECLIGAGEEDATRRLHASWFVDFAETAAAALTGPNRVSLLQQFEGELVNLRQALAWAEASGETELAHRLVAAMAPFWEVQGYLSEGWDWSRRVLEMPGLVSSELRGRALSGSAMIAYRLGSYERASEGAQAALEIAEQIGSDLLAGGAMIVLGNVAYDKGDLEATLTNYEVALARYRIVNDVDGIADSLSKAGLALNSLNQPDRAVVVLEESIALAARENRPVWTAASMARLAFSDQVRGDFASAEGRVSEALPMQRLLNPITAVGTMWLAGTIARDMQNWRLSSCRFRESLELRWKWREQRGVAESLSGLAELAALTDRFETAAKLFGGIATLREVIGVPGYRREQQNRDHALHITRQHLGAKPFDDLFAIGQAMARGDIVTLAIELGHEIERGDTPVETFAQGALEPGSGEQLTARELEVLRCLAQGKSDREIGETLFISPRTVARHLHSVYQKLRVNSRSSATAYAYRQGLV